MQKIWKVILFIFCMPNQLSQCKTCLQAYLWWTVLKCLAKMYWLKSYLFVEWGLFIYFEYCCFRHGRAKNYCVIGIFINIIKLIYDTIYTDTGIYSAVCTNYWKMAWDYMGHGFIQLNGIDFVIDTGNFSDTPHQLHNPSSTLLQRKMIYED